MKSTILLNFNENTSLIEKEEQGRFIRAVLESLGLPLEDIWNDNGELSFEGKAKLRKTLTTYGVEVISDNEGNAKIYCDGQTVGEWNKCTYTLREDRNQRDPKKRLYLEMHVDYNSVFEEQSTE